MAKTQITAINRQSASKIIQAVEDVTGITYEAMSQRTRKREIVQARHIAWYMMWKHCHYTMSLKEMGQQFGNSYDHSTCIHGRDTIMNLLDVDRVVFDIVNRCEARFEELERGNIEFDITSSSGLSLAQHMDFKTHNVRAARLKMLV